MEIRLGSKVRDRITGFVGTASARIEYINGCIQYCLIPSVDKDGKYVEGIYFDFQRLEVIDEGITLDTREAGGPDMRAPSTR